MIKLSRVFSITLFICGIVIFCFVDSALGKVVITGEKMEIKDNGEITVLKGNLKVTSDWSTITARNITYNRGKSVISAYGDVNFLLNLKDNEMIEGCGNFAHYDMNKKKGKIWGDTTLKLKYFMNNLSSPMPTILCAQEVYIDDNLKTLNAYDDVEVITSYGTIYSDNAIFSKKEHYAVFRKDKKRPVANIFHDGIKGVCEADKMVFYGSSASDKKGVAMYGLVEVKIEMKDKKSDA
ncbi:MAG: hypothetical protein LBI98_00365 [Endomicrobium sp.]|nr:hypothetical protein [Endomicrobium sp.]